MGDVLRTRIAAVVLAALTDFDNDDHDACLRVADAVIVELGLRVESDLPPRRSWRPTTRLWRYVTEWTDSPWPEDALSQLNKWTDDE